MAQSASFPSVNSSANAASIVSAYSDQLKKMRETSGLSQSRAANATRISLPFIEYLERGELSKLPGVVFGRGFTKSLSKLYCGRIDPELLLKFDRACEALNLATDMPHYIDEPAVVLPSPEDKDRKRLTIRQLMPSYYIRGLPLLLVNGAIVGSIAYGIWVLTPSSAPDSIVKREQPPIAVPVPVVSTADNKSTSGFPELQQQQQLQQQQKVAKPHSSPEPVPPEVSLVVLRTNKQSNPKESIDPGTPHNANIQGDDLFESSGIDETIFKKVLSVDRVLDKKKNL